jgi:septum formation initiator
LCSEQSVLSGRKKINVLKLPPTFNFAGKMNSKVADAWAWTRRYISLPLIVAVGYIVFVLFFNENSYSRSAELQDEIDRLHAEIKENNDTMLYYLQLNRSLDTDPQTLERIVREKYHMQRPNEDVYIIE